MYCRWTEETIEKGTTFSMECKEVDCDLRSKCVAGGCHRGVGTTTIQVYVDKEINGTITDFQPMTFIGHIRKRLEATCLKIKESPGSIDFSADTWEKSENNLEAWKTAIEHLMTKERERRGVKQPKLTPPDNLTDRLPEHLSKKAVQIISKYGRLMADELDNLFRQ